MPEGGVIKVIRVVMEERFVPGLPRLPDDIPENGFFGCFWHMLTMV